MTTGLESALTVTANLGFDTVLGHGFGGYDHEGEPVFDAPITIANLVADRLAQGLMGEAKKAVDYPSVTDRLNAAIDAAVADRVSAVLDREFTPTGPFGEAKGEPTTLAEIIAQRAEKWLTTRGDDRGYGTYKPTHLERLIDDAVGRAFKTEVSKAVDAAKTAAMTKVSTEAAEVFTQIIKRAAS